MAEPVNMPTGLRPPHRLAQLGELSLPPLEGFLNRINYDVADWSLGRNRGSVGRDIARFTAVAEARFAANGGQAFTLIGWSLGGIIARETARLSPHLVREVITMGTPIIGGPKYTTPGQRYAKSANLDQFEREVHERNSIGFDQPLTVLYSNRDGIVGPDIAKDIYNPQARNTRVDGDHSGGDHAADTGDPSQNFDHFHHVAPALAPGIDARPTHGQEVSFNISASFRSAAGTLCKVARYHSKPGVASPSRFLATPAPCCPVRSSDIVIKALCSLTK